MPKVVAHSVNPFLFGSGTWVYSQLVSLREWHPIVVCKRRENREDYPLADVFSLEDLSLFAQLRERVGRRVSGGVFPFMQRAIEASGARLLHSHFASQGWTDLPLAAAVGKPQIASFYGADIWKNSRSEDWLRRYRELFARGKLFLVEGEAMRAKVISLGCPAEKVVVQHLGVELGDTVRADRKPAADGLVRVLASGRAVEKKGHEFAVRAFARAQREMPNLRMSLMIMANSKPELERLAALHALVVSENVAGLVDFPPPRPYAEYRRSLYDYHIYFAPSMHAKNGDAEGGSPVSVSDMSATGTPIVASRHCDIPEVAPHGVSGELFDENDLEGATQALLRVAASPEAWNRYGRAGRAHIEREYSLSTQAARLEAIYERCVES